MIEEGVLENPKVDAIFGLHINSGTHVGKVRYRTKGIMLFTTFCNRCKRKTSTRSKAMDECRSNIDLCKIIDGIQSIISRNSD